MFCSSNGCGHGKHPLDGLCAGFTCKRCSDIKCPLEWSNINTNWLRPEQHKRPGGGLFWVNVENNETRSQLMQTMVNEMTCFQAHAQHVHYHKRQMRDLLENFGERELIIKADFIQNIVHDRGRETSQSYYGKRQTQFLSFVVWYRVRVDGELVTRKVYLDYLSSYLKHNSLYFQRCLTHVIQFMQMTLAIDFDKVLFHLCFF